MNTNTVLFALCGLAFVVLLQRLLVLGARLDRLSRLEGKVDALLRANGVNYDPFSTVPASVQQALEQGEHILAIKLLREATGLGLKEAKEAIDELRRRQRGSVESGAR